MAVTILRIENGLDYSRVIGEDHQKAYDENHPLQSNDSTTNLLENTVHGSNDSLSRNISQGLINYNTTELQISKNLIMIYVF